MAGVESIKEEFLTCAICTEIYNDPCTLSCQHSFCRTCITDFIKTQPESIKSKTIPCAFCRQVTPAPNPAKPAEEWAKQMKPSLMLQGLMDKLHSGHKHVEGKDICSLCKEVGETTPASSWCSECEVTLCSRCTKMHRKAPALKNHVITDLSSGMEVKRRRTVRCKEHEDEEVKFVCKDCNKAICQTCCILKHRKCEQVVTIASMVPEIKSALSKKKRSLDEMARENLTCVQNEESKIKKLKTEEKRTREKIESTVDIAVTLLRKKEKELLIELGDISDKQIEDHEANMKSSKISAQMYQQHSEFIDQTLQSESQMEMYDMYQVCLSGAVASLGETEEDTRNTAFIDEMKFTPNMDPLRKAITDLGKVDVSYMTEEVKQTILSGTWWQDSIDIKHPSDNFDPDPIDVTVMEVKGVTTMVVADYNNTSLKSVSITDDELHISKLQLSGRPLQVASMIGGRLVATTDDSHVMIAEFKSDQPVVSSVWKSRKQYWSITSIPGPALAAGFLSPGIDIVDLSGKVIRTFTSENTGLSLMKNPHYLCSTNEGNILVSDHGSMSVYCLTPKGGVVFSYTPPESRTRRRPKGITVCSSGDIMLADSKTIMKLTSDGAYVKDVLTSANGVDNPSGLCTDKNNKLYVSQRGGDRSIKVFKLQ